MACSTARTLDVAGEPWSPLILRDVWVGITRFDRMQRDLGISGEAGPPVLLRHRDCGQGTHAEVRCACCGELLDAEDLDVEPGPGQPEPAARPSSSSS
jgi:hypothetical protein